MEKLRADRWNECVVLLQKNMRRFMVRQRYLRMREITIRLQQVARKKYAIRKLELLRQEKAVIAIQKYWRGYLARKRMAQQRAFVTRLQAGKIRSMSYSSSR